MAVPSFACVIAFTGLMTEYRISVAVFGPVSKSATSSGPDLEALEHHEDIVV
jgi:hypothetical protein